MSEESKESLCGAVISAINLAINEVFEEDETTSSSSQNFASRQSFNSCHSYEKLYYALNKRENNISNESVDSTFHGINFNTEAFSEQNIAEGLPEKTSYNEAVNIGNGDGYLPAQSPTQDAANRVEDSINISELHREFQYIFTLADIEMMLHYFENFDSNGDGSIELPEVKLMLEKLAMPQTHLAAKNYMSKVLKDTKSSISFAQFLLLYAEVIKDNGIAKKSNVFSKEQLANIKEIDVAKVGVSGAKCFFEAKIKAQSNKMLDNSQSATSETSA